MVLGVPTDEVGYDLKSSVLMFHLDQKQQLFYLNLIIIYLYIYLFVEDLMDLYLADFMVDYIYQIFEENKENYQYDLLQVITYSYNF